MSTPGAPYYPTRSAFADLLSWRDRLLRDNCRPVQEYEEAELLLLTTRAELTAALRNQEDFGLVAEVDQLTAELVTGLLDRLARPDFQDEWESYLQEQRQRLSVRIGEPGADTL